MNDLTQTTSASPAQETPPITEPTTSTTTSTTEGPTAAAATAAEPGKTLLTEEPAKPAEGEAEPAKPEGAPEAYTDFTIPEGMTLEKESLEAASALFKELGLTQANAQKLVDFHTGMLAAAAKASQDAYATTRKEWLDSAMADKDISANLPAIKETIGKAKAQINDPELVQAFNQIMDISGVGDHPAFIKMFHRMAKAMTEGTHVAGAGPTAASQQRPGAGVSAAKALYPDLP